MKKKKLFRSILIALALISSVFAQELYDINTITTIEITFEESNWDYLLDQLYAAGDEERLMGTVVVNGIQFDSVGVRYKGNSSYSSRNEKNPLNIKLDYIIDDQEYDNFGTIKLSNGYNDPSFVREVLSYEIARDYMPASLSNYATVTINGKKIGLYSSTQDVDKYFAKMHFGSKDNSIFKGELTNENPNTTTTVWGYYGGLPTSYSGYYEIESDEGWYKLVNFLDIFNNDPDLIEDVLNVDQHLWMLAFDNLLVNLDAPINFAHNYYLFEDNAGRFNPIIWDLNESFGVFSRLLTGSTLSTSNMQQLTPYLHSTSSYYPIIKQILSDDTYKKMYIAHMKTIINDHFINGAYRTRALELQDIIDTEVQNDPNKFYTYANFTSNIDNTISSGGGRPGQPGSSIVGITQLMDTRAIYLNSLSDFTATAPEIANIVNTPTEASIGSQLSFTCEVSAADTVKFCYRTSENDKFTKIYMLDDGAHQDGNSGDGVYGASITASSSMIQYYIYAENGYAAAFMPEGAEHDIYEINISGKLVINEFLADNETIITDANGDFDDWIELYNNTANTINLNGYYLSDDNDNLTQWAFPDTSIEAYSYLIVWADKDEDNSELHASFKLSASGEAIYLVNSSEEIIDEVIFGAQSPDISMGRYENGLGNFIEMTPTFSAENIQNQSGIDDTNIMPLEYILEPNYPNPFNPLTNINFSLPESGEVSLSIYDMTGRVIDVIFNSKNCTAGTYSYQWNAQNFSSGVYIAVLESQSMRLTQKMILMK